LKFVAIRQKSLIALTTKLNKKISHDQNATSSGGVILLSNHLMAYHNFQFFDGLSEFDVFFFFLLEQLQGLDIFTEFIRKMNSVLLALVDEVGEFFFSNKGNNRTTQNLMKSATLPQCKQDPE
jgi:hypothetical protein